jgi:hypothetical protein
MPGQARTLDQVDLAHSARAQQPQNPVPGEHLTDPQRHGHMLAAAIDCPTTSGSRAHAPARVILSRRSDPSAVGLKVSGACGNNV